MNKSMASAIKQLNEVELVREAVQEMQTDLDTALDILREVEWSNPECSNRCYRATKFIHHAGRPELHCPECEMAQSYGHTTACQLNEILNKRKR